MTHKNTLVEQHNKLYAKIRFIAEDDLREAFAEYERIIGLENEQPTPEQQAEFTVVLERLGITQEQLDAWVTLGAMSVS